MNESRNSPSSSPSTDPLDLIAEAQRRQRAAERERDDWKERAEHERRRCRAVIDLLKLRPMPKIDADDEWKALERAVREMAKVLIDPYAAYRDDDDPPFDTHDLAMKRMTYRLQAMLRNGKARQG